MKIQMIKKRQSHPIQVDERESNHEDARHQGKECLISFSAIAEDLAE